MNYLIRFRSKKEEEVCIRKYVVVDPKTKRIMKDKNGPIAEKDASIAIDRAEKAGYKVIGNIARPKEKTYMCFYLPHKDDKFIFSGKHFVKEFKDGSVIRGFQIEEKKQ